MGFSKSCVRCEIFTKDESAPRNICLGERAQTQISTLFFFLVLFCLLEAPCFWFICSKTDTTHTHAYMHTLTPTIHLASPAGRYTWFTGTSQKKKKICYHSNHMVLAWHSGHCHGNNRTDKWAVPGQPGLGTCKRVYTHIQDFFCVHCPTGPASVSSPVDNSTMRQNQTPIFQIITMNQVHSFLVKPSPGRKYTQLCLPWLNL